MSTVTSAITVPEGISVDSTGNIYVVSANAGSGGTGDVYEIAWNGSSYNAPVSLGHITGYPYGLAVDSSRDVFVADGGNPAVWELKWNGTSYDAPTHIWVSSGGDSFIPSRLAIDSSGNIYMSSGASGSLGIREIPFTGTGTAGYGTSITGTSIAADSSSIDYFGITLDASGNIYGVDGISIYKIAKTGSNTWAVATVVQSGYTEAVAVAVTSSGQFIVSDLPNLLFNFTDSTTQLTVAPRPTLSSVSYDTSTGKLTLTGANLSGSSGWTFADIYLEGNGGNASYYQLTGGTLDAASTATSAIIDVSATDKTALATILNAKGTKATDGTTYNFYGDANWDNGGAVIGTMAVTVSGFATASNPVPPPPSLPSAPAPLPTAPAAPAVPPDSAPPATLVRTPSPPQDPGSSPSSTVVADVGRPAAAPAPAPSLALAAVLSAPGEGNFQVAVVADASGRAATGGQETVLVAKPISDTYAVDGRVSFAVPADAFAVTNANASVTLTATTADGKPLPAWLTFNTRNGTFEGTPPPGAPAVEVKVKALDNSGHEAAQTFKINTQPAKQGDAAPAIPAARLAQAGRPGLAAQLHAARHAGPARLAAVIEAARRMHAA